MTRAPIFDAIKAARDGASFTQAEVARVDALLDSLAIPGVSNGVPSAALTLIKQFEGCRLQAYPDPGTGGDPWTIGWGATGPGISRGVAWTQQQADDRLAADVARFADGVRVAIGSSATSEPQLAAMISLAYNIGLKAFGDSTLLRFHKSGEYAAAAAQFIRWNKAGGKVMDGLTRRRVAEARVYQS